MEISLNNAERSALASLLRTGIGDGRSKPQACMVDRCRLSAGDGCQCTHLKERAWCVESEADTLLSTQENSRPVPVSISLGLSHMLDVSGLLHLTLEQESTLRPSSLSRLSSILHCTAAN